MIEQAHLQAIEARIADLKNQRKHADSYRLQRSIDGLIQTERSRLIQWQRLHEIRASDGE